MNQWVEISFDCLPLRSVSRLDVPMDASPKYIERCERIKRAMNEHGSHNTYFLYNAHCRFHVLNHEELGQLNFHFEGTLFTSANDCSAERCDLEVKLVEETCDWLTEPVVQWFLDTTSRAVLAEFDRYIAAGDLERTLKRMEKLQAQSEEAGGFVGMYL